MYKVWSDIIVMPYAAGVCVSVCNVRGHAELSVSYVRQSRLGACGVCVRTPEEVITINIACHMCVCVCGSAAAQVKSRS